MTQNNNTPPKETPEQRSERLKREGLEDFKKSLEATTYGTVKLEMSVVNGNVTIAKSAAEKSRI